MFDRAPFESVYDKISLRRLPKPALVGIVLLAVALALSAVLSFSNAHQATAVTISTSDSAQTPTSGSGNGALTSNDPQDNGQKAGSPQDATLFVYVTGEVVNPGLYEIASDARVGAAIELAGGFTEEADVSSVNLARKLNDGEQLIVLSKTTVQPEGAQSTEALGQSAESAQVQFPINVNRASASELEAVPGIGPSTAQKIIADRTEHGSFASVDDLVRIPGIGDKRLESLRPYVCVG